MALVVDGGCQLSAQILSLPLESLCLAARRLWPAVRLADHCQGNLHDACAA